MALVPISNREIIWLNIPMDNSSRVNILYSFQHLNCAHEGGFQRELLAAFLKEIFEGGTQEIHHHNVLPPLCSVVLYLRYCLAHDSCLRVEPQIDFTFQVKLLISKVNVLEFDGNPGFIGHVVRLPNFTKGALAEFLLQFVFLSYYLVLGQIHYNFIFFKFNSIYQLKEIVLQLNLIQ